MSQVGGVEYTNDCVACKSTNGGLKANGERASLVGTWEALGQLLPTSRSCNHERLVAKGATRGRLQSAALCQNEVLAKQAINLTLSSHTFEQAVHFAENRHYLN